MTTRQEQVYALVSGDVQLQALGVEKVRRGGALDNPSEDCFLVLRWGTDDPGFKTVSSTRVTVWAYDEPGAYDRIDAVLERLKALFSESVDPYAEWNGSSDDLYDDQWRKAVRNTTFTVV